MADVVDSEMLVFDEFLEECFFHPHMHPGNRYISNPHATGSHPDCINGLGTPATYCYWGALLWCGGVVYRIGEYERETNSWWARWPD